MCLQDGIDRKFGYTLRFPLESIECCMCAQENMQPRTVMSDSPRGLA